MNLLQLEVKNFCQHSYKHINFPTGLIIVTGPNGIGKSNLFVEAPRFAFLGETFNTGARNNDLRYDTKEGYVKIVFDYDGRIWELKRLLHRNSTLLTNNDGYENKKTSDINSYILNIFSLPSRIINEMIFMRQEHITKLLFDTPATREKELQYFFGTIVCEHYRDQIQNYINAISIPNFTDQKTFFESEIKRIKEQVSQLYQDKNVLDSEIKKLEKDYTLDQLRKKVYDLQSLSLKKHQYIELQDKLKNDKQELFVLQNKQKELEDILNQIQYTQDPTNKQIYDKLINLYNKQTTQNELYNSYNSTLQDLQTKYIELKKRYDELQSKYGNISDDFLDGLNKDIITIKTELKNITTFLSAVFIDVPECPFCHTKFSMEEYKKLCKEKEKDKETYTNKLNELQQQWNLLKGHQSEQKIIKEELNNIEKQIQYTKSQLSKIKYADVSKIKEKINKFEKDSEKYTKLFSTLSTIKSNIEILQDNIIQNEKLLSETIDDNELKELPILNQKLKLLEESYSKLTQINYQIKELESSLNNLNKKLIDISEQENRIASYLKLKSDLQYIRDILHRDKYPRIVALKYMKKLEAYINKYLEHFDASFKLFIEQNLEFTCRFSNNIQLSAMRLSGGEKVMLSIAYRFACVELFTRHINFIILDEPTIYLDESSIEKLAFIIKLLSDYAKRHNKQIIIITHEEALVPYGDHHIELSN